MPDRDQLIPAEWDYASPRVTEVGVRTIQALTGPDQLQVYVRDRGGFMVLARAYTRGHVFVCDDVQEIVSQLEAALLASLALSHGVQLTLSSD